MKKIKFLSLTIASMLLFNSVNAQTPLSAATTAADVLNGNNTYWQFTTRTGWDWPLYNYKERPIKYLSGPMLGLGINRYWTKKWGVELDFDWYRNRVSTGFPSEIQWFDNATTSFYKMSTTTTRTPIDRFFIGIGPSRRWAIGKRITLDGAVMLGAGLIDGGQILVKGTTTTTTPNFTRLLAYSSGWDKNINWAFKLQLRGQYWLNKKWGINGGVYYVNQGWNEHSTKNGMLVHNGFQAPNSTSGWYNYYLNTIQGPVDNNTNYGDGSSFALSDEFSRPQNTPYKVFIHSYGAFVGIAYRIYPKEKEKKNEKYCLQVTARDKYTRELIPNTAVAIKNSAGIIVQSAITDAFGNVKFCDIKADDYKIEGIYNDVALEGNSTNKSEFKKDETLQKEILYADRSFIVKGRAVECNTSKGISGIKVIAENNELAIKKSTVTDANGNFSLTIPEKGEFQLYGQKDSFFSQTEIVNASNYDRDKILFVKIEICADKIDCDKTFPLKNIHFDLDKYAIRPDAKPELNKLVQFLKDYPTVKIELGSHTDCRASNEYNQTLSQNRANASAEYLVSQGIDRSRIVAVGYGETKLLNECADGVSCSESQHQINRRTEFKVICPK